MCSTPFGITEFGTMGAIDAVLNALGAQRLSASLNSAPCSAPRWRAACASAQRLSASLNSARGVGNGAAGGVECSTPFGITEFGTVRPRLTGRRPERAQRLSASLNSARPPPLGPRRPQPGAQRLSASLNSAPVEADSATHHLRGAQRLSASLNSARTWPSYWMYLAPLRAQRLSASLNSAPVVGHGVVAFGCVLNAFRHH